MSMVGNKEKRILNGLKIEFYSLVLDSLLMAKFGLSESLTFFISTHLHFNYLALTNWKFINDTFFKI